MWTVALLIKPFAVFVFICFVIFLRVLFERYAPEGWLKRLLLRPLYYTDWEDRRR